MIIHAWRIVKAKHAAAAFSGDGAKRYGGRWTSPGVPAVYVAGSASLAILEMLVHLQSQELMKRYVMFEAAFDGALVMAVAPPDLPKNWRKSPPPAGAQQIGDAWIAQAKSPILRVPSVIVPTECNYLLNPAHPAFARIAIGPRQPISFDPRLLKPPAG